MTKNLKIPATGTFTDVVRSLIAQLCGEDFANREVSCADANGYGVSSCPVCMFPNQALSPNEMHLSYALQAILSKKETKYEPDPTSR